VTCQDSTIIAPSTMTRLTTLDTTDDSVLVRARCAPMTSLLSRDTSAPVWARMKNATGIRCTWSKTSVRRLKISPSPMRAEKRRCTNPSPASTMASPPMAAASIMTTSTCLGMMPSSMIAFISRGLAITITASSTTSVRKAAIWPANGRA
jgi:hypothetical protein